MRNIFNYTFKKGNLVLVSELIRKENEKIDLNLVSHFLI